MRMAYEWLASIPFFWLFLLLVGMMGAGVLLLYHFDFGGPEKVYVRGGAQEPNRRRRPLLASIGAILLLVSIPAFCFVALDPRDHVAIYQRLHGIALGVAPPVQSLTYAGANNRTVSWTLPDRSDILWVGVQPLKADRSPIQQTQMLTATVNADRRQQLQLSDVTNVAYVSVYYGTLTGPSATAEVPVP